MIQKKKKKSNAAKVHHPRKSRKQEPIQKGLWKGSIAFGLVNIPVYLESAQQEKAIHFRLIDKHDHAPIGYKQINKVTGKEVASSSIIKGYEYEKGQYVLLAKGDFDKANLKATRTIEIEDFVNFNEIDPMFFDRPYYIIPQKGGEKAYVLLREALIRTGKAGIAKIVLHTVQHLVMLSPRADYLILQVLRFANEIKEIDEADMLDASIDKISVSDQEVEIAEQLIAGQTSRWQPDKYENTYRNDLMKFIHSKIKRGATAEIEEETQEEVIPKTNLIDLTALLKKSLSVNPKRKSKVRHSEMH